MMEEKHITVARKARYFVHGTPTQEVKYVWFALHGYGQLASRFLRHFEHFDPEEHLVIAPEGLHRFYNKGTGGHVGASWMTKEDRITDIEDYIRYLDQLYEEIVPKTDTTKVKVIVLGFSQGAATATRWAALGHSWLDELVLWAGVFPPDVPPIWNHERMQELQLTLACGTNDEYIAPNKWEEQLDALKEQGFSFETIQYEGRHRLQKEALDELKSAILQR